MLAKFWLENLQCGYHLAELCVQGRMVLKWILNRATGYGGDSSGSGYGLHISVEGRSCRPPLKKLFDDRVSIPGRCTNFLFDAGDNSPFLPKAVFFRIRYL